MNTEPEPNAKFEEKLRKLVDKYGARPEPMDINIFLESAGIELEVNDIKELKESLAEDPDVDLRPLEYYFHWEKVKNESFKLNADFDLEKTKGKHEYYIIFYEESIVNNLKNIVDDPDLYEDPPSMSTTQLLYCIHNLRIKYAEEKYHNEWVKLVLDFAEDLYKDKYKKMDNLIEQGIIDFQSLWYLLDRVNTVYTVKQFEQDVCFRTKSFSYRSDVKEEPLMLYGQIIVPADGTLNICEYTFPIPKFTGTKKIESLKIKKFDQNMKDEFLSYGTKIIDMYKDINHMTMDGKQFSLGHQNAIVASYKKERVMIDFEGMDKYGNSPIEFSAEKAIDTENITDEDRLIVFPFASIYNLGINKQWGLTHVKNLKQIQYKTDALDYLILDESKKSIIKCLINNKRTTGNKYGDFIEGKGNGLVFLLYGAPGTGKTFTAEATCDFLQKPLYSLNIGDLGTDPENLEIIMNMVIDYAKRWDAIIMMDEVDVFLEQRQTSDIIRNAMVGVFLKILEYHDGIIFLTTNRLNSLDPAIKSRINLMLCYKDLETKQRRAIWESMFKNWKIEVNDDTMSELCKHDLNGREIRNYMKIVFAIHEERKMEITGRSIIKILEECFKLSDEFTKSIKPAHMYT